MARMVFRDRAALHTTMTEAPTASYVLDGHRVPAGWLWRRFARPHASDAERRSGGSRVR